MKKRTTAALLGGIILLIVAVFVIVKLFNPTVENTKDSNSYAQSKSVLQQKAVLYISKNGEELEKGNDEGQLVFINDNGRIDAHPISAVEYGATVYKQKKLFIEQSNMLAVSDQDVKTTEFEHNEYRGMRAGYVPKSEQFYALYNSGLSKTDDYKITLRYETKDGGFSSKIIPHFVSSSGEAEDRVILLTQDLISYAFQLKSIKLNDNAQVHTITELPINYPDTMDAISQVLVDDTNYYFLMSNYKAEDDEEILLYEVNRKTNKVTSTLLAHYRSIQETESSLPLTYNDSLYKWDNGLYYMNGMGKVYRYDLTTKKVGSKMTLTGFPVADSLTAQMQFKDNYLYVAYQDEEQKMYLDQYDLNSNKRIQHVKVKGVNKHLKKDAVLTDLTIIE